MHASLIIQNTNRNQTNQFVGRTMTPLTMRPRFHCPLSHSSKEISISPAASGRVLSLHTVRAIHRPLGFSSRLSLCSSTLPSGNFTLRFTGVPQPEAVSLLIITSKKISYVTAGVRWDISSFPWISSQHTCFSDATSISTSLTNNTNNCSFSASCLEENYSEGGKDYPASFIGSHCQYLGSSPQVIDRSLATKAKQFAPVFSSTQYFCITCKMHQLNVFLPLQTWQE